eukprot:756670-Hanusia_phi.AAC.17
MAAPQFAVGGRTCELRADLAAHVRGYGVTSVEVHRLLRDLLNHIDRQHRQRAQANFRAEAGTDRC